MSALSPQDDDKRLGSPPLQGRGRGWGVSAEYLADLHRRAAAMRRNPTEPEKRLWRILSGSQLNGLKFRRQAVLPPFIADFLCPYARLIVEVDGDTHDTAKDRLRDDLLELRGYSVLRVTNLDVMSNLDGVWQVIASALASSHCAGEGVGAAKRAWRRAQTPHPHPSPEGEELR